MLQTDRQNSLCFCILLHAISVTDKMLLMFSTDYTISRVAIFLFNSNIPLGKDTIRKKIVKRILSPITILRSVSEEEKTISDLPQIASPGYEGKSNDVLVEARPKKLLDMNPLYLAQELCLIDKELLVRIPWNELSTCGWMTKHKVHLQ